jgi:hemerythrin-like metal-binding protein
VLEAQFLGAAVDSATMALFTWSESMSVGVARIDKEHQGLVDLINLLHSEMLAGKSKESLGSVLEKLIWYTKVHFATEATLFRTYNYSAATGHLQEHTDLTQKAVALQNDFKAGKAVIGAPVLNFLRDWLTNHIMKQDMAYKLFFASKGVK